MPAAGNVNLPFEERASCAFSRLFIQVSWYSLTINVLFLPQVPQGSFLHCIVVETEAVDNHRLFFLPEGERINLLQQLRQFPLMAPS